MMPAPSPIVLSDRDKRVEVSGLVLTETFRRPGLLLPPHFHVGRSEGSPVSTYLVQVT